MCNKKIVITSLKFLYYSSNFDGRYLKLVECDLLLPFTISIKLVLNIKSDFPLDLYAFYWLE